MRTLLCPGDVIIYTCAQSSSALAVITWWTVSGFQCSNPGSPVNTIQLMQLANSPLLNTSVSCGTIFAVMTNINGTCYTSALTIPTPQSLNGTTVTCRESFSGATIGNDTLIIQLASPPGSPTVLLNACNPKELILTWTTPTTGSASISYNVTINGSSSTVVIPANGSPLHTHTFTKLMSDTLYTVAVVAINCAGAGNGTSEALTVADPPDNTSIDVMFIIYVNRTLSHLYITWIPVGGSVTVYKVRVVGDGVPVGNGSSNCTASTCSLTLTPEKSNIATIYSIFVASVNGHGSVGLENSSNVHVTNNITAVSYDAVSVAIQCSFWNDHSLYCVVCCSTDPSVPPDLSVYNISLTRGTEVSVHLDGLASDQVYYCKAAATSNNSHSLNCTIPGFRGVNSVISFKTLSPSKKVKNSVTVIATIIPALLFAVIVSLIVVVACVCVRRKQKGILIVAGKNSEKDIDQGQGTTAGLTCTTNSEDKELCVMATAPRDANHEDIKVSKKIYGTYEDIDSLKTYPKHSNTSRTNATENSVIYSLPSKKLIKISPGKMAKTDAPTNSSMKKEGMDAPINSSMKKEAPYEDGGYAQPIDQIRPLPMVDHTGLHGKAQAS